MGYLTLEVLEEAELIGMPRGFVCICAAGAQPWHSSNGIGRSGGRLGTHRRSWKNENSSARLLAKSRADPSAAARWLGRAQSRTITTEGKNACCGDSNSGNGPVEFKEFCEDALKDVNPELWDQRRQTDESSGAYPMCGWSGRRPGNQPRRLF